MLGGVHSFNQSLVSTSVSQSFSEAPGCSMEQGRQGPGHMQLALAGKWREGLILREGCVGSSIPQNKSSTFTNTEKSLCK